ncbi:MAG: ArsR family transcriptional regulator [Rhodospirillales bacterium]
MSQRFENLHDAWREHLRIALLRTLLNAPAHELNESILVDVVRSIGINATRDQVRIELQWLSEAGLASLQSFGAQSPNELTVATLTARGEDVANGRAIVPGVKKPSAR